MSGTSLTDTSGEKGMIKTMGMVIFSLVLLSLFIVSMARLLGLGRDDGADDPLMRNALISRIEPVGAVRTSAEELEQVASADGGGAERSGQQLVEQGVCAGCHAAGAGGAPLLGDEEAWAERRELGLDALVASVVNGKGSMPAGGGSDYSEDEIRRAVQHIALFEEGGEGGDDAAGGGAAGDEGADAEGGGDAAAAEGENADADADGGSGDEEGAGAEGGETEASKADDAEKAPAEDAGETEAAKADGAEKAPAEDAGEQTAMATTDEGAADEEPAGELAEEAVAEDVGTAAPSADAGAEELLALIASGEEPEGLTDDIKAQVNGVCAGCHVAGVANAPMLGDVDAWSERAELGLAALSQSVINGKGVMPARGGSTLTDEQVPIAIRYQMGKKGP